jgi:phytoene dehydrogenase-like protein
MSKRVAIVGGGISGLTTAFLLKRKGFDVAVFEASDAVGGNVQDDHS